MVGIGVAVAQPLAVTPPKTDQDVVNMELSQMEVNEAMAALSAATGYNIILSKTITGKINAFFVDMDPARALEETIRVNGFYYEKKDNVVWVLTPEEYFQDHNLGRERRIVPLKNAWILRKAWCKSLENEEESHFIRRERNSSTLAHCSALAWFSFPTL